ncbi:MAG: PIG-L family deacetylase [Bryobacteraceae bacterium]
MPRHRSGRWIAAIRHKHALAPLFQALVALLLMAALAPPSCAQPDVAGAAAIRLALHKLNVLGSVLMIGAHPDDEHTSTLAYLARGRGYETAYLSLTRGEGGQNLVGPEQGDLLGVIRTQELLGARRVDGAEQFFSRAIDFGFSKTPEETFDKWGREKILADIVWTIRKFRPDVIVLCFSGTPRDGHGHHQVSAILGKEAFFAAADRTRFPEQLPFVEPWQAKRIVWNVYGARPDTPGQIAIDTGGFDPALGYSFNEIAAMSRDMHRSQGMGTPERKGADPAYFAPVAGELMTRDLFDGIAAGWDRIPDAAAIGAALSQAEKNFDADAPERAIPPLIDARKRLAQLKGFWVDKKLREVDEAIALCAGLWLDASADRWDAVPGSTLSIHTTALNRSHFPIKLASVNVAGTGAKETGELAYNQPRTSEFEWKVPEQTPYSQPYWLARPPIGDTYDVPDQRIVGVPENAPVLEAVFHIEAGGAAIEFARPVHFRYVDHERGQLTRPLAIVPPVAVTFAEPVTLLPDGAPRKLEVRLKSTSVGAKGEVRIEAPRGWKIEPAASAFDLAGADRELTLPFEVTPPTGNATARIRAIANIGGKEFANGMDVIAYPHIEPRTVFPASEAKLVRADVRILAKQIGYVMGAGDEIPAALGQLGCEVTPLGAADLASGDLARFDAIVTGVRAFNVRADLRANFSRLLEYVRQGGTLVVQYNILDFGHATGQLDIGPYPITISHDRVTVEEAPVRFPNPESPLLQAPNRIVEADFDGWIQERGLYFASEWDARYQTLLESHDPGEPPHEGGTLYTRYGKGVYVFTAYSWFRELPAGVPGAFRVFANLVSAGKALAAGSVRVDDRAGAVAAGAPR